MNTKRTAMTRTREGFMRKRYCSLFLLLILFACALAAMPSKVQASARSKAMKAYKKYLFGSVRWYDTQGRLVKRLYPSDVDFAVARIDKDKTPELINTSQATADAYGHTILLTYRNGAVRQVLTADGELSYYPKKGVFEVLEYFSGYHMEGDYAAFHYKKGNVARIAGRTLQEITGKITYKSAGGTTISKKKYQSLIKKYAGKKTSKTPTFHKNTAVNRSKYLK